MLPVWLFSRGWWRCCLFGCLVIGGERRWVGILSPSVCRTLSDSSCAVLLRDPRCMDVLNKIRSMCNCLVVGKKGGSLCVDMAV